MKKKLGTVATLFALLMVMLVVLTACGSTWGKIKGAYKKEGWVEAEISDTVKNSVKAAVGDDYKDAVTIHVLQKDGDSLLDKLAVCIVVEFKSTKEMEESLKDLVGKKDAENIYEELQKLPTVNGNCMLVGLVGADIFKSTK